MAHVFGVTGRKAEVDPRKNKPAKFLSALVSSFWHQRGALALPPPQLCDRANSTHAKFPQDQRPDARAGRLVDSTYTIVELSVGRLLGHLLIMTNSTSTTRLVYALGLYQVVM